MSTTIYGASDDLIEVEGDVREEFPYINDEDGDLFAFSNGVVLRVRYTSDGLWRIDKLASGDKVAIDSAGDPESDNYSDRATIDDDVFWVVQGGPWAKR